MRRGTPGALLTQLQSEGQVRDGSWQHLFLGPYPPLGVVTSIHSHYLFISVSILFGGLVD